MPKIGRPVCREPRVHVQRVEELLAVIAHTYGKTRGDVVVAYHEDISVYAIRMWFKRPIPKKHWGKLSELSGFPISHIEEIARGCFDMNG
jgi:hypothetical protein